MENQQQDNELGKLELYGVIVHSGSSAGSGHYYAFVKNGSDWFEVYSSLSRWMIVMWVGVTKIVF